MLHDKPTVRALFTLLGLAAAATLGCGCTSSSKLVKAKGQLTIKGQPLKVDPKAGVTIAFIPVVEKGGDSTRLIASFVREDSTFTVPGTDGNGIPEGKYRISIDLMVMPPTQEVQRINEMFNSKDTKIVRDVKSGDETIVIDVSKPSG